VEPKPLNFGTGQIFIFLIFSYVTELSGQSTNRCDLNGRVTDKNSGEPVQGANVFLSGTTYGASTSQAGFYCLENIPEGIYQLIFQHVGYEIKIKSVQLEANRSYQINARLEPKIYDSEAIQVFTTEPKEWMKQLEFFIKEFIGESHNADECEILNPEVLNFKVNQDSKEFIAYTDSILRIKNNSLGYQINLVLVDFLCKNERLSHYLIYPKFELLEPANQEEMEDWIENRRRTYQGSFKHFLSVLARGKLEEENFHMLKAENIIWLQGGYGESVGDKALKIIDMGPLYKKFVLESYLKVSYLPTELHPPSIIKLELNYIMIDTLGNVLTPWSVIRTGGWYKKRVADTLPMEYMPTH
jgi:hypothetical protein